jgi:exodeoxyribonuclease V alpha subunit
LQEKTTTSFAESLSGLIERVTLFNDDTGFGALKVKAKGHRDLVTVVGSALGH